MAALLAQAGHRVFAPSLTGLADRRHLFSSEVSLATHVEDIVGLIEAEELDGCVLVGHSYGGNVITGVGDRLRNRVAHYVYFDAVVPPDDATEWRWSDFNTPADRALREHTIATAGAGRALPPPPAGVFGIHDAAILDRVGRKMTPMPAATYQRGIKLAQGGTPRHGAHLHRRGGPAVHADEAGARPDARSARLALRRGRRRTRRDADAAACADRAAAGRCGGAMSAAAAAR